LFFVPLAVASEDAWPHKGDTVYISASFKKLNAASPVAGARMQYDMPACAKVEVVKADVKKSRWVTRDPIGGTERLEGAWLPRMHKTKAECDAQLSADGEPSVERSGETFKIVPAEAKK
jgi:hypothetical protein